MEKIKKDIFNKLNWKERNYFVSLCTKVDELSKFKRDFEDNINIAIKREKRTKERLMKEKEKVEKIKRKIKEWIEAYNDVCEERDKLKAVL